MFFLVVLDMSGKEALLNHLKTASKITSKPKRHFKKGTMYSICITFLIVLHIQSCYPGSLQDAIAENKHVKEIVPKVAF